MDALIRALKRHYDRMSWAYDLLDWPFEHFRYRHLRPGLVGGLKGKILEAGVGTGRNLPYYSPLARVTGVDLSPRQLERARKRASLARCRVELRQADATKLPFKTSSFDASVATFLFCVLPDALQLPALKELLRVTRPGGLVRILEYRYSDRPFRRLFMRLMAPYTQAVFGARFDRATEAAIAASGAELQRRYFLSADVLVAFDLRVPGRPKRTGMASGRRPQQFF